MVAESCIPKVADMDDHKAEVNWAPRSEVMRRGTPKRATQL